MTQRKISFWWVAALALVPFFTGCQTRFNNLTPDRIPQNPSGLYTFSFGAELIATNVVDGSERASITINGETFPMVREEGEGRIFSYDYAMPAGVNEARYFYALEYNFTSNGSRGSNTYYSTDDAGGVYVSRLINRFPIQLVADRGPPGASIDLVGSGFAPGDIVVVGGQPATTTVNDANSIDFIVPFLPTGQTYDVTLQTAQVELTVGRLRIDPGSATTQSAAVAPSTLSVLPEAIDLFEGESVLLIVSLAGVAPPGGLVVDVTTDVPESVIMPEVVIPEGAETVSITVEGGIPGEGNLFFAIPGSAELVVPIVVQ